MFENLGNSGIAHVIQLSVAPVFLLTSIAAILGVMTNRLARVVTGRARWKSSSPERKVLPTTIFMAG